MFQYFKGADNKLCFLTCLLFKLSRSYQGGANSFFRWPGACSRATLTCRDRRQQKVFLFPPDIIDGDGFIVIALFISQGDFGYTGETGKLGDPGIEVT